MASVNDLLFGLLQLSILSIYKTATQDFYQGYEKKQRGSFSTPYCRNQCRS